MAFVDNLPVSESLGVFVGIAGYDWLAEGQAEPLKEFIRAQPEIERTWLVDRPGGMRGVLSVLKPEFATAAGLDAMVERLLPGCRVSGADAADALAVAIAHAHVAQTRRVLAQ